MKKLPFYSLFLIVLLFFLCFSFLRVSKADNTKLAVFPNGWYTDEPWGNPVPALNVYQDTSTTYDGMYTLRVDPTSTTNQGADFWTVDCAPGDYVVIECWIKTAGTPNPATASQVQNSK